MDPKWVLTNDQKRTRFRNYFKRKDEVKPSAVIQGFVGLFRGPPEYSKLFRLYVRINKI